MFHSVSFLFLFLHWSIHFHHNNLFHSSWWFLPPVQVQSIQLIDSCCWIHTPFPFIPEPLCRERERATERLLAWLIDRVWCIGTECRKVGGSLYSGFCGRILELQRFNQKWSGFGILGFSLVRRLLCVNLVGFVLGWIREVVIFGKRVLVQSWLDFTSSVACRQQKVCWVWLRAWV